MATNLQVCSLRNWEGYGAIGASVSVIPVTVGRLMGVGRWGGNKRSEEREASGVVSSSGHADCCPPA